MIGCEIGCMIGCGKSPSVGWVTTKLVPSKPVVIQAAMGVPPA
jgi:hypothetical protein